MIDLTIVFAFLLAIAAGQVPAAAQPPQQPPVAQPPGTPAAPPAAVPSSRKFTTDAGLMFSVIKPDKTADFEMVMAKVKDALGKSQDPKRKQQALSWRVFKGQETAPGGGIVYVWFIDPPVKDVDYTVTDILTEAFPNEAQDLWAKYTACFAAPQSMLNLSQVLTMGPAGATTVPK